MRISRATQLAQSLFAIGFFVVAGCGKEDTSQRTTGQARPLSQDEAAQLVHDKIVAFTNGIRSDDAATRRAAFDSLAPTKAHLSVLFGRKDAELLWKQMEPKISQIGENPDWLKKDLDRLGQIVSVSVYDVRSNDPSGIHKDLLDAIPAEIPAFRAVIKSETISDRSSPYLVINGQVVFIWEMEKMLAFVRAQKK